jgi:RNA polymerase sigma factor (sigma-70 family)
MASKDDIENNIISIMRGHFLKYTDEVLSKYKDQIDSAVRWYIKSLPRHVASSEADDLSSEARIAFVNALKTWDPRVGELWPYVSVRLKGAMQDYLRRRGSDPVAGLYEYISSAANVYMAFNPREIAHEKSGELMNVDLDSVLKDLEETEVKVIKGYYEQDKTFKQIGEDIGLSESQVSRICKTATLKIKKLLKH